MHIPSGRPRPRDKAQRTAPKAPPRPRRSPTSQSGRGVTTRLRPTPMPFPPLASRISSPHPAHHTRHHVPLLPPPSIWLGAYVRLQRPPPRDGTPSPRSSSTGTPLQPRHDPSTWRRLSAEPPTDITTEGQSSSPPPPRHPSLRTPHPFVHRGAEKKDHIGGNKLRGALHPPRRILRG